MTPQAQVQEVSLATLHMAPWNPRSIKDSRFKSLCASIQADPERPSTEVGDDVVMPGGGSKFRTGTAPASARSQNLSPREITYPGYRA